MWYYLRCMDRVRYKSDRGRGLNTLYDTMPHIYSAVQWRERESGGSRSRRHESCVVLWYIIWYDTMLHHLFNSACVCINMRKCIDKHKAYVPLTLNPFSVCYWFMCPACPAWIVKWQGMVPGENYFEEELFEDYGELLGWCIYSWEETGRGREMVWEVAVGVAVRGEVWE